MKKHIIFFTMMLVVLLIIVLSCNREELPATNAATCPQISLGSIAGSDSQAVFMNSPIVPIAYNITLDAEGDSTSFAASALPPGVTGSYSGRAFIISGIPTTTMGSPFTYTVSAIGSACQGVSVVTGRIEVDSCATMNLSSGVGTDTQTVSVNHPIVTITYSTTGTAGVTVSSLPAGVTGTFSEGIFTIAGTPTTTAGSPFTYTLLPTSNNCEAPITGMITVTP